MTDTESYLRDAEASAEDANIIHLVLAQDFIGKDSCPLRREKNSYACCSIFIFSGINCRQYPRNCVERT